MEPEKPLDEPLYERIYATISRIPYGKVATYGQIAQLTGGCTARMVGYALAALKSHSEGKDIPWQRVINAKGMVSVHGDGIGTSIQRELLIQEGIKFNEQGRLDFSLYGWE